MKIERCMNCMCETESYPCPHCGFDGNWEQQDKNALEPGTIIGGRYLLGCVREWGGVSFAYIGLDLIREQRVMVRELFPIRKERREGFTQVKWRHAEDQEKLQGVVADVLKLVQMETPPGIVDIYDMVEQNGTVYIIMECIEGTAIERIRPMAWEKVMHLFLPVIHSLEQVHALGIVYRDIKPMHLILAEDGTMKHLDSDFFWSMEMLDKIPGLPRSEFVLVDDFRPIEQYAGRGQGSWTDVYSVAATMLDVAVKKPVPNALKRMTNDMLNLDAPEYQAIPAKARQALRHALAVQPKQRTQSMAEFARELGESSKGTRNGFSNGLFRQR